MCALPGVDAPPEGSGEEARLRQEEWIDKAVQAFCGARGLRARFERAVAKAGG